MLAMAGRLPGDGLSSAQLMQPRVAVPAGVDGERARSCEASALPSRLGHLAVGDSSDRIAATRRLPSVRAALLLGGLAACRSQKRRAARSTALQAEPHGRRSLASSCFLAFAGLASARSTEPQAPAWAEAPQVFEDEVVQVVDGDTVKLAKSGRCRFIGVNTPETVGPRQREQGAPPDCFGPEASKLTKSLLPPGTKVRIELDVGPTDKYGRELAYVYRASDGLFINAELVKQGVAKRYKVAPNVRYDPVFLDLEQKAKAGQVGLWKACAAGGSQAAAPAPPAQLPPGAPPNPGDVKNCKDFASYADAKKWFDTYFPYYGDVAKLDGDGDGQPCEGLRKRDMALAK